MIEGAEGGVGKSHGSFLGWRSALAAGAVAIAVTALGVMLDWIVVPGRRELLYSDIFTGIVAGAFAYGLMRAQNTRHKMLEARLRVNMEMNHHIRNAITPLAMAAHLQDNEEVARLTREAVGRIEWALREILPRNQAEDMPQYSPEPKPNAAASQGAPDKRSA